MVTFISGGDYRYPNTLEKFVAGASAGLVSQVSYYYY